MNERTLRVLEFDKITSRLMTYTSSSLGREAIENLCPASDWDEVERALKETSEARTICQTEEFPLRGLVDVRASVKRASIGSTLLPDELLNVAQVCACSRRVHRFFQDRAEEYRFLSEHGQGLVPLRTLEDVINQAISEYGEVKDSASPKLRQLRQEIRNNQAKVKQRLDSLVRSTTTQKYLQEPIVTVRNDRYVLPVKQEYRGQIPGIIHDQSASGATLFIEPMSVVEANNELRRVLLEEEHEVERILQELTAEVAADVAPLQNNLAILAHLDLVLAKGKFSYEIKAVEPALNDSGYIHLKKARHPLLPREVVVPTTVYLGSEFNVLLITGPNTGGKTVTLKTVGLLCLMAQSGLHIPADEGSELPVFGGVFADIGDEQSIEQSLSTFSSHMKNIVSIIEQADNNSLVLLDELGAGTDPAEGAALAMSVIDCLYGRGCRVVATTHYSELKSYAYQRSGVQNASVEFDVDTLRPTYRLIMGLPGKSNAFEIANRLGLPGHIIQNARGYLTGEQLKVEDLIGQLEASRREAEAEREVARQLSLQAEQKEAELDRRLREQRREVQSVISRAKQEAKMIVQQSRRDMDALLKQLRETIVKADSMTARELTEDIEEVRARYRSAHDAVAEPEQIKKQQSTKPVISDDRDFRAGDEVLVKNLGQRGKLLNDPAENGDVQVQLGSLRLNSNTEQLEKLQVEKPNEPKQAIHLVNLSRSGTSLELDLRGQTVDDALLRVDKYLDDASVAGLPQVHIIHGKGTGALRTAVREYLKTHPGVKSYRFGGQAEGGSGVTVVELKK